MKNNTIRHIMIWILAVGLTGFLAGCATAKKKEVDVSMADLTEPARAAVERLTAGGQVEKLTKEVERGMNVYDVEATVEGRHVEYLIAEADGAVLGTEVPIAFSELPEAVQAAAKAFFDTATGVNAMKGEEFGETSYEIEGPKNGKTTEASFDPTGKQIE